MKVSTIYKDSVVTLIGNGLGKALSFAAGIIIARFLGSDVFGQYSIVRNNLFMIAVFSTLGLGYTATKFVSECTDKKNLRKTIKAINVVSMTSCVTIALFVFIFSNNIANLLKIPELGYVVRYLAIIIVFNAVTTTQIGILSGFKAFKYLAITNILSGLMTFILSFILSMNYKLPGALLALLVSQIFNCVINYYYELKLKKDLPYDYDEENGNYSKILSFTLPVALQESLYSISGWLIIFIMTNLSTYTQVGYYSAVTQWINLVMFVPAALRNVILSHLSSTDSASNRKMMAHRIIVATFICSAIPAVIIFILSGIICGLYGEGFHAMKIPLIIGISSTLFNSIAGVYNQKYIAENRNWTVFFISLVRESLFLFISYIFLYGNKNTQNGATIVLSGFLISIFISLVLYLVTDRIQMNNRGSLCI